jgi:ABC-type Na+ efflux pump permease subunit
MRLEKAILVFRKDFIEITRNKEVLLPMLIVPVIFALLLPALSVLSPDSINTSTDEEVMVQTMINNLPDNVKAEIASYTTYQQTLFVMLVYFFTPFFLIIPIMSSSVIASDSFAGEKERNTLEALLATPLTDSELLLGKILVSFIPGMGVTILGAILYFGTVDYLTADIFGSFILPTVPWLVMLFVLSPAISLLGIGVAVIVSSKVKGFKEAQQLSAVLIVPVLALLFGQASGYLMLGSVMMMKLALVGFVVDYALFRIGIRVFQRENILASSM